MITDRLLQLSVSFWPHENFLFILSSGLCKGNRGGDKPAVGARCPNSGSWRLSYITIRPKVLLTSDAWLGIGRMKTHRRFRRTISVWPYGRPLRAYWMCRAPIRCSNVTSENDICNVLIKGFQLRYDLMIQRDLEKSTFFGQGWGGGNPVLECQRGIWDQRLSFEIRLDVPASAWSRNPCNVAAYAYKRLVQRRDDCRNVMFFNTFPLSISPAPTTASSFDTTSALTRQLWWHDHKHYRFQPAVDGVGGGQPA